MSARLSEDTHAVRQTIACGGKTRFSDPHAADRQAKHMRRIHDRRFQSYRCAYCRGWHVGSREAWQDRT